MKKWWLYLAFILLLVGGASAQYYYDYSSAGYGGDYGFIFDLYEQYSGWIDFFIFFLIFFGLSKLVFTKEKYKEGGKLISVGLSFALSIGLVYWESRTGMNLASLGPIAYLLLMILIFFIVFSLVKQFTDSKFAAAVWGYVAIYVIVFMFLGYSASISEGVLSFLNFLFWVALLAGIIILFFIERKGIFARGG